MTTKTPHVALVVPSLASGGSERVVSRMANFWSASGRSITVITFDSRATDFFLLHPGVERISLGLAAPSGGSVHTLRYAVRVVRRLRRSLVEAAPDMVVSFMDVTNVFTLLSLAGTSIPLLVSERTDPRQHYVNPVWRIARAALYRRAAGLVVMTESVRKWASGRLHHFVHVIPNPIDSVNAAADPEVSLPAAAHVVAGMGRLSYEKGFDQLLAAMAWCAQRHPDWQLIVLGEGPERPRLQRQAVELGIGDRVHFPGRVRYPERVLSRADLFVVPSRYEGFNCALAEAMSCGVPAISMDCQSGPAEIIRHGVDGLLVPAGDVRALAEAMDRLMSDKSEREELAARAPEVLERFGTERVMKLWDDLLKSVVDVTPPERPAGRPTTPQHARPAKVQEKPV